MGVEPIGPKRLELLVPMRTVLIVAAAFGRSGPRVASETEGEAATARPFKVHDPDEEVLLRARGPSG